MNNNVVGWFEIYVQDMKRARAFYETVLQVQLASMGSQGDAQLQEMWSFPSQQNGYGATGALIKMKGVEPGGNSVLVYFISQDCAAAAARAASAGGRIFKNKFPIGEHGYIALVYDTEGNLIGLHSMS